jgi:hypothetical protein
MISQHEHRASSGGKAVQQLEEQVVKTLASILREKPSNSSLWTARKLL